MKANSQKRSRDVFGGRLILSTVSAADSCRRSAWFRAQASQRPSADCGEVSSPRDIADASTALANTKILVA